MPIGFEESLLPHLDYVIDESVEVDESCMSERSGAINKSEIVESDEAHFGKPNKLVKTAMAKKNIVIALSMLILAVIPMTVMMNIFY